jgi:hypothetical protein
MPAPNVDARLHADDRLVPTTLGTAAVMACFFVAALLF